MQMYNYNDIINEFSYEICNIIIKTVWNICYACTEYEMCMLLLFVTSEMEGLPSHVECFQVQWSQWIIDHSKDLEA